MQRVGQDVLPGRLRTRRKALSCSCIAMCSSASCRSSKASRRPSRPRRHEVARLLASLRGVHRLLGDLLYGSGRRIMVGVWLRVKDLDLRRRHPRPRRKGAKDRVTVLPGRLVAPLRCHLHDIAHLHRIDLRDPFGAVWLPEALEPKYRRAAREWCWQYVFPADRRSIGHADLSTTMIYTNVLNRAGSGAVGPLDRLLIAIG